MQILDIRINKVLQLINTVNVYSKLIKFLTLNIVNLGPTVNWYTLDCATSLVLHRVDYSHCTYIL